MLRVVQRAPSSDIPKLAAVLEKKLAQVESAIRDVRRSIRALLPVANFPIIPSREPSSSPSSLTMDVDLPATADGEHLPLYKKSMHDGMFPAVNGYMSKFANDLEEKLAQLKSKIQDVRDKIRALRPTLAADCEEVALREPAFPPSIVVVNVDCPAADDCDDASSVSVGGCGSLLSLILDEITGDT
ncbi:hypothetical protein C2E23DRAFT_907950 [Lenzites betulinus]|nr:hypothetical protein C2E23DRAFT_907950 [Lenzites betulinus]